MELHKALAHSISALTPLWKVGKVEALKSFKPLIKCISFSKWKERLDSLLYSKLYTLNGILMAF